MDGDYGLSTTPRDADWRVGGKMGIADASFLSLAPERVDLPRFSYGTSDLKESRGVLGSDEVRVLSTEIDL